MTASAGAEKIRRGLSIMILCSLTVAALIYIGMNAGGHAYYYARAAQLPFYAGLYGVWLLLHGLWINYKQKLEASATVNPQELFGLRPAVRKPNLRRGFVRLGVVLTSLWWLVVAASIAREYVQRNADCELVPGEPECSMLFWSWVSSDFLSVQLALNIKHVLLVAIAPPMAGLLLGLAIAWIARGFSATHEP